MISEGRKAPDLGMPSQAGNNLLWALTRKAKSERELLSMIDKLSVKMGGKYKGAKKKATGGEMSLKPIPAANKGLPKLPKKVRNKMGFMKKCGKFK